MRVGFPITLLISAADHPEPTASFCPPPPRSGPRIAQLCHVLCHSFPDPVTLAPWDRSPLSRAVPLLSRPCDSGPRTAHLSRAVPLLCRRCDRLTDPPTADCHHRSPALSPPSRTVTATTQPARHTVTRHARHTARPSHSGPMSDSRGHTRLRPAPLASVPRCRPGSAGAGSPVLTEH